MWCAITMNKEAMDLKKSVYVGVFGREKEEK